MGDKKYKVYKYTNKINGKIYIGQTCKTLKARADNGKGYIRCTHFWRAIQKYGWENFEGEIIADGLTLDEANELEISLIKSLNSTNPSIGYNNRGGGSNGEMTEEAMCVLKKLRKKFQNPLKSIIEHISTMLSVLTILRKGGSEFQKQ